ncbi:MAG TPA: hypothetical protein VMY87_11895 [Armatimonadota bacterium]|nr:hypothetical protein [Armatimonadota bacterium]
MFHSPEAASLLADARRKGGLSRAAMFQAVDLGFELDWGTPAGRVAIIAAIGEKLLLGQIDPSRARTLVEITFRAAGLAGDSTGEFPALSGEGEELLTLIAKGLGRLSRVRIERLRELAPEAVKGERFYDGLSAGLEVAGMSDEELEGAAGDLSERQGSYVPGDIPSPLANGAPGQSSRHSGGESEPEPAIRIVTAVDQVEGELEAEPAVQEQEAEPEPEAVSERPGWDKPFPPMSRTLGDGWFR